MATRVLSIQEYRKLLNEDKLHTVDYEIGGLRYIKFEDVEKPYIERTGTYRTVRHGELTYFNLILPRNTKLVERIESCDSYAGCHSVMLYTYKNYIIYVFTGDALDPARVRIATLKT